MSFLNQRNIAVFDDRIEMTHQSGSELKMTPELDAELAAATGLDRGTLDKIKGRRVQLSTSHLLVEFQKDPARTPAVSSSLARATRLKSFNAPSGRVHMQEEAKDDDTIAGGQ